jgi:4-aminobutyrate aminotransferase-like enzyme
MSAGDQSGPARYIDMCLERLEGLLSRYPKQHACMVFEVVQGEGGFNTAPREFHEALMRVCKARGVAVWADEIQTFGRTTGMFAFDMLGLGEYIDVCTIGKMSQVCATFFTKEYNPQPGLLSSTFLGAASSLRVGRRVVERLRDGDYYGEGGRNARHHRAFVEQVRALVGRRPQWFPPVEGVEGVTGGVGGMMRFTPLGGQMKPIVELCKVMFEEGVIAFYCGHDPYHVRMLPPLGVMQEPDWARVFEVVERAMARVAG